MLSNLRKLQAILNHRELIQLGVLLVAIITMSFLQALGIASVLPFIGLIMDPELIFKNRPRALTPLSYLPGSPCFF